MRSLVLGTRLRGCGWLAICSGILGCRAFQCSDSGPQSFPCPAFRIPAQAKSDGHLVVLCRLD